MLKGCLPIQLYALFRKFLSRLSLLARNLLVKRRIVRFQRFETDIFKSIFMKKYRLLIISFVFTLNLCAQLKTTAVCPPFSVDILKGRINNEVLPTSTINYIKERFPCATSTVTESDSAKCGGGIFYKDKDIYFYTGRNYIEIGPNFKGSLSLPLMGAARNSLYKWLGHPAIKDVNWESFQTAYGMLILYYNKASKVNKIQFSTESAESIKLCE
jgi:hypothetical protein